MFKLNLKKPPSGGFFVLLLSMLIFIELII